VLAAYLLQSIINKAFRMNLLYHPFNRDYGQDYPNVQFANDTLIILPTDAPQLFLLKDLL
jgi:hypothetical protein